MFEDLPPPQIKPEEDDRSSKKDESLSWLGFAMPPESSLHASLRFKPRFVATGVKESVQNTFIPKTQKKECIPGGLKCNILHSNLGPHASNKTIDIMEAPFIGNAPCDVELNPLAYVHLFDTVDPYDPSIPYNYQELQLDALKDQVVEEKNQEPPYFQALESSHERFSLNNDASVMRISTKRKINNQPAWLDGTKKDTSGLPPTISSSPLFQVLDYSNLSLTLGVIGVAKQLKAVMLHLETFGDFSSNIDSFCSDPDKFEVILNFKSQAPCILSYHSLVVGKARDMCVRSNEVPIVRFLSS
jgi:hypothetical protein